MIYIYKKLKILFIIYLPFITICSIYYFILSKNLPLVGTDIEYYFPRFLDVFLHFKSEGIFSIQWWTPSFGGGIPAFPNPGHMQFVLIPYLMYFFSPWVSTLITYLIFNFIAYNLIFNYFNRHINFNTGISVCAAVIFITNGFWLNHALVGHINFSTFLSNPLSTEPPTKPQPIIPSLSVLIRQVWQLA